MVNIQNRQILEPGILQGCKNFLVDFITSFCVNFTSGVGHSIFRKISTVKILILNFQILQSSIYQLTDLTCGQFLAAIKYHFTGFRIHQIAFRLGPFQGITIEGHAPGIAIPLIGNRIVVGVENLFRVETQSKQKA